MKLADMIDTKTVEAMKRMAVKVEAQQVASIVKEKHRRKSATLTPHGGKRGRVRTQRGKTSQV
jgi:hypothetical protein